MNSFTLLNLVLHPEKVQESDLEQIQELVNEYPYFQAARLLMAKITKSSEHIKTAAAFTSEREVLQKVINSGFNSDVNLPNIDNLEIGKDDLSLFDKLGKEDVETKLGKETNQDFDAHFGDFQIDILDKEEELATPDLETSQHDDEDIIEESVEATNEESQLEDEISWPDLELSDLEEEEVKETVEASQDDLIAEIEKEADDYDLDGSLDDDLNEFKKLRAETEQIRLAAMAAMDAEEERMSHSKDVPVIDDEQAQSEEIEKEVEPVNNDEIETLSNALEENEPSEIDESFSSEMEELKKLKAEAEKSRLAAEKAMQDEENREISKTDSDYNPIFDLPEVEYETPKYDFPNELSSNNEEIEDFPLEVVEASSEEVDIFDDNLEEDEPIEDVKVTPEPKKRLFNFDDSLFSLDDLLEQATVGIDPVRELEKKEPINSPEETVEDIRDLQAKQVGLINNFIDNVPSLKAKKEDADNSSFPEYDLTEMQKPNIVSENLAVIMVKQGKYQKAIDIYRELILKFPEKRTYFASLIENLENK